MDQATASAMTTAAPTPAPWVLLRGLMREQRHWGRFPGQLARALGGDTPAAIVTPDLPGNGERHLQRSASDVGAMVEFCRRDLRARGLRPPYALLALSLGGMVAVEWASRYPHEIDRAVLINTSMRPFSRFHSKGAYDDPRLNLVIDDGMRFVEIGRAHV